VLGGVLKIGQKRNPLFAFRGFFHEKREAGQASLSMTKNSTKKERQEEPPFF